MTHGTESKIQRDGAGGRGRKLLLAVAAPAEARAIVGAEVAEWVVVPLGTGVDLVRTGVGKANAAGAIARLCDPRVHGTVVSIGIAGTYGAAAEIGNVVVAERSVFADEGVRTPDAFEHLSQHGFPAWQEMSSVVRSSERCIEWMLAALRALGAEHPVRTGAVATVSTCSGTDEHAREIEARARALVSGKNIDAVAEAMEGAAVGASAARLSVEFGEVRVISNTTGGRANQKWDLKGSLEILGRVAGALIAAAGELDAQVRTSGGD